MFYLSNLFLYLNYTVLYAAAAKGNIEIAEFLLSHDGIDVNIKNISNFYLWNFFLYILIRLLKIF